MGQKPLIVQMLLNRYLLFLHEMWLVCPFQHKKNTDDIFTATVHELAKRCVIGQLISNQGIHGRLCSFSDRLTYCVLKWRNVAAYFMRKEPEVMNTVTK